jgi:hypothetical protein
MYIIPDYKFCFLASPRTGSKAVAKVLVEKYNAIIVGSHHSRPDAHPEYEMNRDWVICSGVRNHWDAMISWWFKIESHGRMMPLADFLPNFCISNPNFVVDKKLWSQNTPFVNKLLRYEQLNADLDHALVAAGLPPVELPVVTDSARDGRPYQVFYKDDTVTWVAKYFQDEIELYRYKF